MKECWIVTDNLHDEVIGVYETKRDAREKACDFFEDIAEINGYDIEEISEMSNDLYNSSFLYDNFGIDCIVFCQKAKYFPNSLTL
jgi:hypothetical protein